MKPFIQCWCPTYKRPEKLANVVACFEAQTYDKCEMVIFDDAPQFDMQASKRWDKLWRLYPRVSRYPSLPSKFNHMFDSVCGYGVNIISIWEDDDIYLPNHLEKIADAWESHAGGWFAPSEAYSTYHQEEGNVIKEDAHGRFHSSWAYSRDLFEAVGGYDEVGLRFDQDLHMRLSEVSKPVDYSGDEPTFVYRFGNSEYHASSKGEEKFSSHWDAIGRMPSPHIGELVPKMDSETVEIYRKLADL
jgi:hypothetical protein